MEFTHPNIAIQARTSHLRKTEGPLKMVFKHDPRILAEILLGVPVIFAAIVLHLNAIQWIVLIFTLSLYLTACVFRTAAMLQAGRDRSLSDFHVKRIRRMGNMLVKVTAFISGITSLLIFIPIISQLI